MAAAEGSFHFVAELSTSKKLGIFEWLGTNRNTSNFQNPDEKSGDDRDLCRCRCSGLCDKFRSDKLYHILEPGLSRVLLHPRRNNWVVIKLCHHQIIPTGYSIQHYRSYDDYALRNWVFEGSNDGGKTWHLLLQHTNDHALKKAGHSAVWNIECSKSFSKFRLKMTGPNSSGKFHLALSHIEIYGRVYESDAFTDTWDSVIGPVRSNSLPSDNSSNTCRSFNRMISSSEVPTVPLCMFQENARLETIVKGWQSDCESLEADNADLKSKNVTLKKKVYDQKNEIQRKDLYIKHLESYLHANIKDSFDRGERVKCFWQEDGEYYRGVVKEFYEKKAIIEFDGFTDEELIPLTCVRKLSTEV